MKIYKYKLLYEDHQTVLMPEGAKILTFNTQWGKPCIWALVDPARPVEVRAFYMVGTGHQIEFDSAELSFIGSIQLADGDLIFHLFEVDGGKDGFS